MQLRMSDAKRGGAASGARAVDLTNGVQESA
jgi:hypothetical protein